MRLIGGVLVALASVAVGGYVLLISHEGEARPTAHVAAPPTRPADLLARIDRLFEALPSHAIDRPCTDSDLRVPLVLYATAEARQLESRSRSAETAILSSATPLPEIDQRLASSHRIALVRTLDMTEPHASVGMPSPGRYEGQLVVVDTSNGTPLCHTRVIAWSSSLVDQPGVAERMLRDDFGERVRSAFSESGARLHVDLEL